MDEKVNRKVRDSMFRYMYSFDEYRRDLVVGLLSDKYKDSVIEPVTLENVFAVDIQNDLGLMVDTNFLLLSEAQSTQPANIALRMLEYLSRTMANYINYRKELNVYSTTHVMVPTPRLYVVYTGEDKVPDVYHLSSHFGEQSDIDMQVHTLHKDTPGLPASVREYIAFSRAVNILVADGVKGQQFVTQLISFCNDAGILRDLVLHHLEEVKFIMTFEERAALQREKDQYTWEQIGVQKGVELGTQRTWEEAVKRIVEELGVSERRAREILRITSTGSVGPLTL